MEDKQRDITRMVNELISQITGDNRREKPRTDSMRKNLNTLGDWTTKKSIPVHSKMTTEEHNKLVMRANLELTGLIKRYNTLRSFLLSDTHFADKLSAEVDAMSDAIHEMEDIINLNLPEEIQQDADLYAQFLEKREEFLRRFQ